MRLIDRYILREVGESFLLGVAAFTSILLLTHIFFLARVAAETQMSLGVTMRLLVLRVPYFMTYSLPFAMLFAVLMAFGRLSDRNEVTALRTSGWSLQRVAAPVLFAGVVVTAASLVTGEWIVPETDGRFRTLLNEIYRAPTRRIQEHVLFREQVDNMESVFYARALDPVSGVMTGVTITQYRGDRLARIIEADEARYEEEGRWVLRGGAILLAHQGVEGDFDELRVRLRRTPRQIAAPRRDPYEMTIRELRKQIEVLQIAGERFVRHAVALQSKIALPSSSVIFALLAVPLGLRPHRSGRSIGFGLTVLVLLVYYVLSAITITMGEQAKLSPFLAAWLPNIVVACTGAVLLWRSR